MKLPSNPQGRSDGERVADERFFVRPLKYVADNYGEFVLIGCIAFCLALLFAP